jgi:hypothetical protein
MYNYSGGINMEEKIKQCPEFPFFGASYPDARCINGYLWDLDKCNPKRKQSRYNILEVKEDKA